MAKKNALTEITHHMIDVRDIVEEYAIDNAWVTVVRATPDGAVRGVRYPSGVLLSQRYETTDDPEADYSNTFTANDYRFYSDTQLGSTFTQTYEALLIDPFKKTCEVVRSTLNFKGEKGVYQFIGADCVDAVRGPGCISWVDDEGLLKPWDQQGFFKIPGYQTPLAGKCLVVADFFRDDGETTYCDLPRAVTAALAKVIAFPDARNVRVPKPTFTYFENGKPVVSGGGTYTYDEMKGK